MSETFEHLVLLIGTNPLPNFVVADYFLRNNKELKNIYLIYSEDNVTQNTTRDKAENLEKLLESRHSNGKMVYKKIPLSDVSSAREISRDLRDRLLNTLPDKCRMHLNYTGGTKAMGIHVYRAIEQETKIAENTFSYLDARSFRIISDDGTSSGDLREDTCIELGELVELHGYERKEDKAATYNFSQAVAVFKKLIDEDRLDSYFESYKRDLFSVNGNLINKISQLEKNLKTENFKDFKASHGLLEVVSALPEGSRMFDINGSFIPPEDDASLKYAVKFLDGIWLEEYVYAALKSPQDKNIKIYKNWTIKKLCWATDFELDVILMKGYQLIGISCTTSPKKKLCKGKGFEIINRTRQIGGDEAKSVIVSRLDNETRKTVQEELKMDTGGIANILVLGKEDLKEGRLKQEIADFIGE